MSSILPHYRYARTLLYPSLIATGLTVLSIATFSQTAIAQSDRGAAVAPATDSATYTFRYVDSARGNDANAGSQTSPFRSLTKAIATASTNTIIVLAPGTYSEATGEQFPIAMKSGVTIQGQATNQGQAVIISGSGTYLSRSFGRQNITLLGANRAGLRGVTVTNPRQQGYGLWIESTSPVITDNTFTGSTHDGISIVGSSAPIVKNNRFTQNGANGITIYGHSRPEIIENVFENTGFGINIAQNATPRIIGNRIVGNKDGIIVQGSAEPVLRQNIVTDNDRNGLVAISKSQPHLGNTRDPGKNKFANNGNLDINAAASNQTIPAAGNLSLGKTSGNLDAGSSLDSQLPPVQAVANVRPIVMAVQSGESRIGSDTTENTKPAVTLPPIDTNSLPSLAIPRVPSRLAPKLRAVAQPVSPDRIRNVGSSVSSRRQLPDVPTLRVSQPSAFGGTATGNTATTDAVSIPITVPSPASTAPPVNSGMIIQRRASNVSDTPSNILPVPSGNIPVGNTGSAPSVWRNTGQTAQRPNFKFRVYVPKLAGTDLKTLRELVPGAFNAQVRGQSVIQVGAFNDRAEAIDLVSKLMNAGIAPVLDNY